MTESKWPLIVVEQAQQIILDHTPVLPPIRLPFDETLGRVLAEDVYATEDMPPFACSAKDGFAVVASDRSPARRIIGDQHAGYVADIRVAPGTAARITTGAPIPPGADAVVMVEFTEEHDPSTGSGHRGQVTMHKTVAPGADVRPPGQDLAKGQLVIPAGTALGPPELGLLATVGRTEVQVYPQPRVAVMSTGDELVEPGELPGPGQIRDSNRYSLMAAVREAGGVVVDLGLAPDTAEELEARIRDGLAKADVLLTSGGVSMGELDLVKPLLEKLGEVHFGRVYSKPGKPVTFATVGRPGTRDRPRTRDRQIAFALPGFPVSSLVAFEVYVRPALRKMQGHQRIWRPTRRVILRHPIPHRPDRTEFQRAVVTREGDVYFAETTGHQSSGRLLSMVGANALLKLPRGRGDFEGGAGVDAIIIGLVD